MTKQQTNKTTKQRDDKQEEHVQEEVHEHVHGEVEEWKNKYVRALADYQNLERRTREEKQEVRRYAAVGLLTRLFSVVDTFSKVQEHIKDVGLDLAVKQLLAILQEQGVEKIDVLGKQFDPHTMECIEVVEGKDNEVVEELLPGYMLDDKVLRVAHVKVGKKSN